MPDLPLGEPIGFLCKTCSKYVGTEGAGQEMMSHSIATKHYDWTIGFLTLKEKSQ